MFNKSNMLGMLKQAQQAKKQLKKVQKEIDRMVFNGSSSNETVTATVNGKFEITNLELSDSFSSCSTREQKELIKSAVNMAISNAQKTSQEKMKSVTGGMLGDMKIPGL